MKKCADYGDELASKYKLKTVDYWSILREVNTLLQHKDSSATIIGADRVHPGPPGHLVMAYEFLKSTGGSRYVAKINLGKDIARSNAASDNCTFNGVHTGKDSIVFTCKEGSIVI